MTDQFDYRTAAAQAEENAWALADQVAAAIAAGQPALVGAINQAVAGITDPALRDGTLAGIAEFLAASTGSAALRQLLDGVRVDATAAAAARQIAAQRYAAGQSGDGDAWLDYAAARTSRIAPPADALAALIADARTRAAAGRSGASQLQAATASLATLPKDAANLTQWLAIADAWQTEGQTPTAISTTDQAMAAVLALPGGDERDQLMLTGLDTYVRLGAVEQALALLGRLDPAAANLNARTSAQAVLNATGDYALMDRFTARIQQPQERFLALESRFSRALRDQDQAPMAASAQSIHDLLPNLSDATLQGEALLLLARYFATTGQTAEAQQTLAIAAAKASGLPPCFMERIEELKAVLGIQ